MTAAVGSAENPVPRRGARVLVVDAAGRLLLLRGNDPGRPGSRYWYTVGGGLDPAESAEQAAARELFEETGLRASADDLQPLFTEVTDFPYEGTWYRQSQTFYLLRVPAYDVPLDLATVTDEHTIDEHRWWTAEELEITTEKVYPADLAGRLSRILGA